MSTEIITFEQATSLTGKKAIDFFSSEENVKPLVEQVKTEALSLIPNVKTKKGRDEIGSTALKVSKSRKALEDAIDKSVADLKAKVKTATEVKKYVVNELNSAREEVLKPRNEWQAEQDRIAAERVAEIQGRIRNIECLGIFSEEDSKEDLAARIDALEAMDVSEGFSEFTASAATAISHATKSLNDRIIQIVEDQKREEQRLQLEAEQNKNRIQERLTNLIQIPLSLMGKSSQEIEQKIDSLECFDIDESEFGDRTEEAKQSLSQVVSNLKMLHQQAKQLEAIQPKREESAPEVIVETPKAPAEIVKSSPLAEKFAEPVERTRNNEDYPIGGDLHVSSYYPADFIPDVDDLDGNPDLQQWLINKLIEAEKHITFLESQINSKPMSAIA